MEAKIRRLEAKAKARKERADEWPTLQQNPRQSGLETLHVIDLRITTDYVVFGLKMWNFGLQ